MACTVHIGDSGLFAEHRPCGEPADAEILSRSFRGADVEACRKHAREAEDDGRKINWFDDADGAA
jgi:hypothetical protein